MKGSHKKLLISGLIFVVPLILLLATVYTRPTAALQVAGQTIKIERAETEKEKTVGLCCRSSLEENSGMLFVYNTPGKYKLWMKDTQIPLDMYWIDAQKKIIHIEQSIQPESYPQTFGPEKPAQYILETNAGYAKKHNIAVGQTVTF